MATSEGLLFHPVLSAKGEAEDEITRSMRAHLRRWCERHTTPGNGEYIDYRERRSEWWGRRAGAHILPSAIERLAAGGILVEPRYGEEAAAVLRTIVEHQIVENCGGTNYGRPYRTWRDNPLDAGVSSHALAIGLDLLRPSLAPEQLVTFGTYLVPFVDYVLENPPDPEGALPEWNIALIAYVGTGLLALVLHAMGVLDEARRNESLGRARERALLFLAKGSAPIAIAKWQWHGDWNRNRHEVRNWANYSGAELGRRLDWLPAKIEKLDSPAAKASILFVSGREEFNATAAELRFVRSFLEGGGTQFDPDVTEAFLRCETQFREVVSRPAEERSDSECHIAPACA